MYKKSEKFNNFDSIEILMICFGLILILSNLPYKTEYKNMKNSEIERRNVMQNIIIPALKNQASQDKHNILTYSFSNLLDSRNELDILKLAVLNPPNFYDDLCTLMNYFVLTETKDLISPDEQNKIIAKIDQNKYLIILSKYNNDINHKEFKILMNLIKSCFLKDLLYEDLYHENYVYNYHYLKAKIQDINKLINILKSDNTKLSNRKISQFIRELKSHSPITEYNSNLDNNYKSFSDKTQLYQFCQAIKSEKKYDPAVDSVIADYYFNSVKSQNFTFKIDDQSIELSLDVKYIHGLLEDNLGITKVDNASDPKNYSAQIKGEDFYFGITYAPDKLYDTIKNKLSRKAEDMTENKIPYFLKLIKDAKRMSIVFESEYHMECYLRKIQSVFGENYNQCIDYSSGVSIRISEIKNGFNSNKDGYQDLKIIYEIYVHHLDTSVQLECQLNLKELIEWKDIEHLVYDYDRAENDYNTVKSNLEQYYWMESYTRMGLSQFKNAMIILSASILFTCFFYITSTIYNNQFVINFVNNRIDKNYSNGKEANNFCVWSNDYQYLNCTSQSSFNLLCYEEYKNDGECKYEQIFDLIKEKKIAKIFVKGHSISALDNEGNFYYYDDKLMDQYYNFTSRKLPNNIKDIIYTDYSMILLLEKTNQIEKINELEIRINSLDYKIDNIGDQFDTSLNTICYTSDDKILCKTTDDLINNAGTDFDYKTLMIDDNKNIDNQWCLVEGKENSTNDVLLCYVSKQSPQCINIKSKSYTNNGQILGQFNEFKDRRDEYGYLSENLKLSCGKSHICMRFKTQKDEIKYKCFNFQDKLNLDSNMNENGNYSDDVFAGYNRSCILIYDQIWCNGALLGRNQTFNLDENLWYK